MSDITLIVQAPPAIVETTVQTVPVVSTIVSTLGEPGPEGEVEGTPISELPELLSINDSDELVIVSDGGTQKITALTLKNYFNS